MFLMYSFWKVSEQKKISKIIDITRLDGMQSVISIWAKHENSFHILKHFIKFLSYFFTIRLKHLIYCRIDYAIVTRIKYVYYCVDLMCCLFSFLFVCFLIPPFLNIDLHVICFLVYIDFICILAFNLHYAVILLSFCYM
jgi:hypothetical protein